MAGSNFDKLNLSEYGVTGLRRFGPYVYEEFLRELSGTRAIKTYTEMSRNDPTIGAMLFAVKMLIRQVEWPVEKFSENPEDERRADFVKSCFDDMEWPWSHVVAEILSMLPYGWSWHEMVYKVRLGPTYKEPEFYSAHDDGLIGWRKMPIRSQDTFWQWEFNEVGDVDALIQVAPPDYRPRRIPRSKSLLFRTDPTKNNPEGYSILRNAYRPWYLKKHVENIEAIGVERDLAGMPIAWVPPEILNKEATDDQKQLLEQMKKIITNLKRDEQEGVVWPLSYDEAGNKQFDLTLLQTAGRRQFDTTQIINRYKADMLMCVLADWLLLGHTKVGTFSVASSKTELFASAIAAWLDEICNVVNRIEIPRLFEMNGWDTRNLPKLTHGDIESSDLEELSKFVLSLAQAGAEVFPNEELQRYLMKQAGLPTQQTEQPRPLAQNLPKSNPFQPPVVPSTKEASGQTDAYAMTGDLMADCPKCGVGNIIDPVGPWPKAQKCIGCTDLYRVAEPEKDLMQKLNYDTDREKTA